MLQPEQNIDCMFWATKTYDAKVNRNINVTGLENVGKDAAEKIADIAEKVAEDKAKAETEETK